MSDRMVFQKDHVIGFDFISYVRFCILMDLNFCNCFCYEDQGHCFRDNADLVWMPVENFMHMTRYSLLFFEEET